MPTNNPDILVRLAPSGVEDIVNALRKVRSEGARATRGTTGDVAGLNAVLGDLKTLLPHLGLAAVVTGVVALGVHALKSADDLGKMAQRVGTTSENLSVLSFAAGLADVSQEQLQTGLGRLARSLQELRKGTDDQVESFGALGLSADSFAGKDTAQAFDLIAQRMARLQDGTRKTAIAIDIFGRGGAQMIPLLNDIGKRGFAVVRAEAEKMGLIFSTDLTKAAEDANDSLKLIGKQAEGLAVRFISGLAPAVTQSMNEIREATTGAGISGFEELGKAVGGVIHWIVNGFVIAGYSVAAFAALVEEKAKSLGRLSLDIAKQAAIGAGAGAAVGGAAGATVFGVGAIPGAAAGAGAGAIAGIVNALTTATPGSQRQLDILAELREKIADLLTAADPGKLSKSAKGLLNLEEGLDNVGKKTAQQQVSDLEKKIGIGSLKDALDISKQREKLNERAILAERKLADAKVAVDAQSAAGQQRILAAESELLRARAANIESSYQVEIGLARAKTEELLKAADREVIGLAARLRVQNEIVIQGNREQLEASNKRYAALIQLQDDYLKRYRESVQTIIALDKEVANNQKSLEQFRRDVISEGLDEEQKKRFAAQGARELEDQLRSAALAGDVDKARELRKELIGAAQEMRRLGDAPGALRAFEAANDLFQLAADNRKLVEQRAGEDARKTAQDLGQQITELKAQIDKLTSATLATVQVQVDNDSLRGVIQRIRDELGKTPFQIAVTSTLTSSGTLPGFASGGAVPGYSPSSMADNVPILATAGEYMQPVRAVQHYGVDFMESIRKLELPRFAEGGVIGSSAANGAGTRDIVDVNFPTLPGNPRLMGEREQVRAFVEALKILQKGLV